MGDKTTAELEQELMGKTESEIYADVDGGKTPEPEAEDPKKDEPKNPGKDDDGKSSDDDGSDEDQKADEPDNGGSKKSGIKKVLEQRNDERRKSKALEGEIKEKDELIKEKDELIKKLKNGELDDKFDSEDDKKEALLDAKRDRKIAEREKKNLESDINYQRESAIDEVVSNNKAHEQDIRDTAKANPNLAIDDVLRLVISKKDPLSLVDQQELNKVKSNFDLGGSDSKSEGKTKSIDDMTIDELEGELDNQWKDGKL